MAGQEQASGKAPAITFTEQAVAKLREVTGSQDRPMAGLRLEIVRRGPDGFQHVLYLVPEGEERQGDVVTEAQGFTVFVPPQDAPYVDGVKIHYEYKGPNVSGLEFENPNPLWFDETAQRIQELFDTQINPMIAAHGGWVDLLGVEGDTAYVRLGGGCQGCGMADVTLKMGIEEAIKETVPEIERVVDTTDHAAGTNPYFAPAKK
ncbi:MAG TPA: NifU family protein [Dehalococcoidia bacterium]